MAVARSQGLGWVQSLTRFGIKPGLERTRRVLEGFGSPEQSLAFLHIAGTNGKGSVCAILTAILNRRVRVGTFTSPARDYRARFVVDGNTPDDAQLEQLADEVRVMCEQVLTGDSLTEFEALTVMAILYFAREHVDVVVWEAGLGGRFDATNVVWPRVTAITNVGRDHMDILGGTLRQVGIDKAGIVKAGVPLVTAADGEGGLAVRETAGKSGVFPIQHGTHFFAVQTAVSGSGQTLHYRGLTLDLYELFIPLFGRHQSDNAAVALAVWELAGEQGLPVGLPASEVRAALAGTTWPGRFDVSLQQGVPVVLDGAHNPEGALRLATALEDWMRVQSFKWGHWTLVIGVLDDKDAVSIVGPLLRFAGRVIVTQPRTPRATPADVLAKIVSEQRPGLQVKAVTSVSTAVEQALVFGHPVCCFGSLYTVDEARESMSYTMMGETSPSIPVKME